MSTKKLQILGNLGNKIYTQNDEPVDAADGSLWIDLDENIASSSGGVVSSGKDGGYYIPSVSQVDENTIKFSFRATSDSMNNVADSTISIPSGKNGDDGFSPTVTISEVNDGATITITDKNGATTATITDGHDGISCTHSWNGTSLTVSSASGTTSADLKGKDGYTPQKGVDYWTNADKEEIKEYVVDNIIVDESLSDSSVNPVQNKVVTSVLESKANVADVLKTLIVNVSSVPGMNEKLVADKTFAEISEAYDNGYRCMVKYFNSFYQLTPNGGSYIFQSIYMQSTGDLSIADISINSDDTINFSLYSMSDTINSLIDTKLGVIENGTY